MKAIDCIEHVTVEGERWDTLAWRYYGDPLAYGRIIEANPALDISSTLPLWPGGAGAGAAVGRGQPGIAG